MSIAVADSSPFFCRLLFKANTKDVYEARSMTDSWNRALAGGLCPHLVSPFRLPVFEVCQSSSPEVRGGNNGVSTNPSKLGATSQTIEMHVKVEVAAKF